jgi:hypothetical protein
MTTRTCSALHDRGWMSQVHPIADTFTLLDFPHPQAG